MVGAWLDRISPCHRIVGSAETRPGWVEALRTIYDHELVIFTGASYAVEIGGQRVDCPPESFIIVPPGVRHVSRETSGSPGVRRWIHFDWVYVGDASSLPWMTYAPARPQESLFRPPPSFVPSGILHGSIRRMALALDLFRRIDSLFNGGSLRDVCVSRGLLLELFLELLCVDSVEQGQREEPLRLASKIRRTLNSFAEQPFQNESSLQDYMAQAGGMSYAHQCRVFKSCYGISPLKYVNEIRMTRVKNLLRDTSCPISEIATITGFENLCYFSRVFKKSAGMSPREYRKRDAGV